MIGKLRPAPLFCAALALGGCAQGLARNSSDPPPAAAAEVWMGDLLRDGYRIDSDQPFIQATRFGPKTYQYVLSNGSERWACYALDSAVDRTAVTDRSCLPYDPASKG